jgi:hypothetical protein
MHIHNKPNAELTYICGANFYVMLKRIFSVLFLLPVVAFAQPIDFSSKSFDFGSVNYTEMDSMKLTLTNTTGFDVSVTGIDLLGIYDATPFYVKDSVFTMTIGNSHDVWIYFEPEQNILHLLNAVVKTDFRGDYLINLEGEAHFLNAYYANSYNDREDDLKASLKTITGAGYNQLSYSVARDNMYGTIDNVNGDVECVYTGRVATFNDRPGANNNSFNCEHTFPQGFFSQNLPMRSDIHHLFSTDVTSNSQRGNYEFGIVTGSPSWTQGGSKRGSDGSSTVFEPRDVHKGQVARSLFYFVVRYQDYSSHVQGQESVLRNWFNQYPVTQAETQRNNDIYAIQNNRNPFVDYPQLLKRISKISGSSVPAVVQSLYVSRDTVDMRNKVDSTLFTVSLMNSGNTSVVLTNFRISNTANFDFESAQSDRVLLPGEGYEMEIRVNPTITSGVSEALSFDTDIPGMSTMDIALLGDWSTLSVGDLEKPKLSVYPNPAKDQISLTWEEVNSFEVKILNISGQEVYSNYSNSSKLTLDIRHLPKGTYVVKTFSNEKVNQTVLVVE